ncbi:hypothetical protein GCM10027605_51360 [Micromonospora zhanjiangensis]
MNDHRQGEAAAAALLAPGAPPAAGTTVPAGPPRAIVTMGDQLARGVLRAAAERGLAVPGQLAVTGWDDSRAATEARPALTTVRQSLRDQGYACARAVLDLSATDPPPTLADRWELVVRESTGRNASGSSVDPP